MDQDNEMDGRIVRHGLVETQEAQRLHPTPIALTTTFDGLRHIGSDFNVHGSRRAWRMRRNQCFDSADSVGLTSVLCAVVPWSPLPLWLTTLFASYGTHLPEAGEQKQTTPLLHSQILVWSI